MIEASPTAFAAYALTQDASKSTSNISVEPMEGCLPAVLRSIRTNLEGLCSGLYGPTHSDRGYLARG